MSVKRTFKWVGLLVLIGLIGLIIYVYPFVKGTFFTYTPVPYDANLTIVYGGGGNSGILTSDSAVLVIDTKMAHTQELYDLAKQKAGDKPIIVINTHMHPDHTAGNKLYKGCTIIAGAYDKALWTKQNGTENLPTVWLVDSLNIHMGNETVTILNVGAGHTSNDLIVYLHNRKMLFTGDLVFANMHPVMDVKTGCNPEHWLSILHMLHDNYAINTVIPGHGEMGNEDILKNFTHYMEDMKAAAADESKVADTKAKYDNYMSLPFISSFHKDLNFWKKHANGKAD